METTTPQAPWILIVDDEEGVREIVRIALELQGYGVYSAKNGKEALEILERRSSPDLILLDLMMPVMNGWAFAEKVASDSRWSTTPIVLLSAVPEQSRSMPNAQAFLAKPFDFDLLLRLTERYCGKLAS